MADIKAKLGVDGEASFKKAIQEATTSVKEMKSALTLAKSEYQATGDKAKYLQDKSAALKGEIEAQKSMIEALKSALDNAKTKYGENSSQVSQWQTKLNNAKAALNNMTAELAATESGLTEVSTGMDTATTDTEKLAIALDGLNEKGDLSALKSGLDTISGTLQRAAQFAVQVGKALWGGTVEASEWADTLATQSQVYGIDTKTLQQWTYASKLIDTEVESILKARQKMVKGLSSTSAEVEDAWAALGISTKDENGNFKDATALMWEALDALGKIENETLRDNIAMTLFGKSAAELNPLIKAGRDAWEAMMEEASQYGAVLSDSDLQKLTEFNDQWQRMSSVATAMKYQFFAALSPAMGTIADSLTKAAQALGDFLNSAEGQEAIGKLGDSIAKFVTTLVDKLPELMPAVSGLVDALTGLLGFVADHATELTAVLGTLFVGSKAGSFGVGLAQAWTGLRGLFGGGAAGAAAGAGANAAAGAGAAGGGAGVLGWLGNLFTAGAASGAAGTVGLAAGTAVLGAALDAAASARVREHYAGAGEVHAAGASASTPEAQRAAELLTGFYDAMSGANTDVNGVQNVRDFMASLSTADLQQLQQLLPNLSMWQEFSDRGLEVNQENSAGLFDEWGPLFAGSIQDMALEAMDAVTEAMSSGDFAGAGQDAGQQYAEGLEGASEGAAAAGENAANAFVNTITGWFGAAFGAGQGLADAFSAGVQSGLGIASPSKVMQEMGLFTAEGFALGIEDGLGRVEDAVGAMTDATVGAGAQASGGIGAAGMAGMLVSAIRGMTVEIDGSKAGAVIAPRISDILGEQADSWRYDES